MSTHVLQDKKILLGVTGSIAAYKAVVLLRLLVKAGADVQVIMTHTAASFVAPLTFSTLSKHPVITDLAEHDVWSNHVMLGRWADLLVVAPCSCHTIARMAGGLCDDILLATYLSAACPVCIAPAMDEDMWLHPATQKNVALLKERHNIFLPVQHGELASGLHGEGRMSEPEAIEQFLSGYFSARQDLTGLSALVTAGPTFEAIDPVRFIGNRSTGTMGLSLARELQERGARVHVVAGPVEYPEPAGIDTTHVQTAAEMHEAVMARVDTADIVIMAAAVADYTVARPAAQKIKKQQAELVLHLTRTRDILAECGKRKKPGQTLVGFALETHDEEEHALEKLRAKNADLIVLNSLRDAGAGFGKTTNKIAIFDRVGHQHHFDIKSKKEVARDIVNTIIAYRNA